MLTDKPVRRTFNVIYSLFKEVLIEFDAAAGESFLEITPISTEFVWTDSSEQDIFELLYVEW